MSLTCPYCGGAIVQLIGATRDAIPNETVAQSVTQSSPNGEIAHGSEVQGSKTSPKTKTPYNQGYAQSFLDFWAVYPIHRDKRKAFKAWRNAIARLGATADANAILIAGAIRYRDDPNRVPSFTKYGEGWLNADGWEDDPLPFRLRPGDPEAEERERLRQKKHAEARRFVEEERRERRQEQS